MGKKAFVVAGGKAAAIANDTADFRYCATTLCVAPGAQIPARSNARFEVQYMVEDGMIEFMIGGATVIVLAGDFVRIPVGTLHAYRNTTDIVAHVLVRSVSPAPIRRAISITIGFAA